MKPAHKAVLLMLAAMFLIPAGDTAGKLLTAGGVSPFFVAWSRFLLGALMLLPVLGWARLELHLLRDWRIWLRSLMVIGAIVSILTALRTEPIANVFAAFFVGPILSYFLSARLLGEPISLPRTLLLGLGFVGVLLVVKPGADMSHGMLFALLAGMFYGSYLTTSRWLADVAAPRMLLMTQLIIGALLLAPVGAFAVPAFEWGMSGLVLASAACSMLGNLLLVMAYRLMHATLLAPLVYVQLVAATLFGVLVFGDVPDLWAMAGMLLLIGSGLGSFLLSRVR